MSDFLPDLDPNASPLNAESKRELIRSTISYFTSRDIIASEALESYKSVGLGIRESDFYQIYRDVLGIGIRANRINSVNSDRIPSDAVFAEKTYNQKQRYRFDVSAMITDPETGDKREEIRTIYTNSIDTMSNMRSQFQDYFNEYNSFTDEEVGEIHFLGAYIDKDIL